MLGEVGIDRVPRDHGVEVRRAPVALGAEHAAQPLRFMVNAINDGRVAQFAAFDRQGEVVQFG